MSAPPTDDRPVLLLIGAGGFVGSHLKDAAEKSGLRVVAASRRPSDGARACDLCDPVSLESCIRAVEPDLVVNAAGVASVRESWERPGLAWETNATGTLNLLTAMAENAPEASLVCLSSAEVYGEREEGDLPLKESLYPNPVTPYASGKFAMEGLCGEFSRALDMRIVVVRVFNLTGPGQRPEFVASGLAKQIAEAELAGEKRVELALGNPAAVRDFTDVRDAAQMLLEFSRREIGGVFNLCSGRAVSIAGLVEELARVTPLAVSTRQEADLERPVDPSALVGDPSKLKAATGISASIPLSRTLADLLDWWRFRLATA